MEKKKKQKVEDDLHVFAGENNRDGLSLYVCRSFEGHSICG